MFKKEAEEILNNHCDCELLFECMTGIRCRCSDFEEEKKLLLEGIEFGYNKGKEEVEQWHILAENPKDVPAENSVVKVLTEDNIIQESTYFYDDYFEEMAFSNVGLVKVLAWKEIILPKESEIESEMFPEITLPKGSAEFVDKVIADAEKRVKEKNK